MLAMQPHFSSFPEFQSHPAMQCSKGDCKVVDRHERIKV